MNYFSISEYMKLNIKKIPNTNTNHSPKMITLNNIKSIIFDIYGTLVISKTESNESLRNNTYLKGMEKVISYLHDYVTDKNPERWLNQYELEINKYHLNQKKVGIQYPEVDIRDIWEKIVKFNTKEITLSKNLIESIAYIYEIEVHPTWEMPNANETINYLKNKFSLGIISNCQFYTSKIVEFVSGVKINSNDFNSSLVALSFKEKESKPSEKIFNKISYYANSIGIKNSEILYIGNDFKNDILPCQRIGFKSALFLGDKSSMKAYNNIKNYGVEKSDIVLTNLNQIKEIINN